MLLLFWLPSLKINSSYLFSTKCCPIFIAKDKLHFQRFLPLLLWVPPPNTPKCCKLDLKEGWGMPGNWGNTANSKPSKGSWARGCRWRCSAPWCAGSWKPQQPPFTSFRSIFFRQCLPGCCGGSLWIPAFPFSEQQGHLDYFQVLWVAWTALVHVFFGAERGQYELSWPRKGSRVLERVEFSLKLGQKHQGLPFWHLAFSWEKGDLSLAFPINFFQTNSCWFHHRKEMSAVIPGLSEPLFKEQRFPKLLAQLPCPSSVLPASGPGIRDEPGQSHRLPPWLLWLSHLQFLWDVQTRPCMVWI